MTKIVVIRQPKSGLYWVQGVDAPDQWVPDIARATRRPSYTYLTDSLPKNLADVGCILAEFEVTTSYKSTGRTTEDLFREGVAVTEWAISKARQFPNFDDLDDVQKAALVEIYARS